MVRWIRQEVDKWKLNTNGSFIPSIGKVGIGGAVRTRNGQMVMAFASPIHLHTNNYSVVLQGTLWCCNQHCYNFTLELDSLLMVKMILVLHNISWKLHEIVKKIQKKVKLHGIMVQHCYREGNTVAESLAKYATNITNNEVFLQEDDHPQEIKGALCTYKLQIPSFRIKPKKH
ncbi:uncharacterized protein LOC129872556 [Solanum dulcamara]|uniref:uncharacterized protein LOC129872556 n=1 Tax=Solanum dulcamara TaxID=45834 RepID=UPI00248615B7|nr:uncharacterized protein LOC129872556 [Solanum dulcamara]